MDDAESITSVARTTRILEELAAAGPLGVTEIADRLDVPPGTIHGYLKTLAAVGWLRNDDGTYHLTLQTVAVAEVMRERHPLYTAGFEKVEELANDTEETVTLLVEVDGYGIPLHQSRGAHQVDPIFRVGEPTPLHASAAGKAILGALDDDRYDSIIDRGLEAVSERTITDPAELESVRDYFPEPGHTYEYGSRKVGLKGVGAPIVSGRDGLIGAVDIVAPAARMEGERFETVLPQRVKQTTNEIQLQYD